jgi:outer membrane protein assembly factor BamA
MFGAALPFGNAADRGMPFSKRFFLGGTSSMRAWTIRQIGPGRVAADPLLPFQLGDIRLEINTEWRFKFNSWIAGALFVDAGNLWLWKNTNQTASNPPFAPTETGVMDWDFLKELAICSGFGLRLDFSLFIIRLDYGLQLYNPAGYGLLPNGKIQYWNSPRLRVPFSLFKPFTNSNLVLAIGYPF